MPDTAPLGDGALGRVELATSLWDRSAHAIAAEYAAEPGTLRPTDAFARQSLRRYLRGDGEAAMVWADRAALRASTPHVGHGRAEGPHQHRLVLPEQPIQGHGYQVQALVDSAVAEIGVNPDWQRVQKSLQLGPSGPTILVNVRADRRDTSSNLTVAFGNSGAVRQPYDELLRGGPEAALERVRTATDYELMDLEAAEPGPTGSAKEVLLSPLMDPAMAPPGGAARSAETDSNVQQAAGARPETTRWTGPRQQTPRSLG
jgi:hypothetical protein